MAVLGADDAQRLADLLVVDPQVAHVVRGPVAHPGPTAGAQVQGVELVAGLQQGVGQPGLEEVVVAAVQVEHGAVVAGGGAGRRDGPPLVDQDGVIRPGGGVGLGHGDPAGHPRPAQDVGGELGAGRRRRRGHGAIVAPQSRPEPCPARPAPRAGRAPAAPVARAVGARVSAPTGAPPGRGRDVRPFPSRGFARPPAPAYRCPGPSRAAERPGSTTLQQPPLRGEGASARIDGGVRERRSSGPGRAARRRTP